ncbi:hypothetical protein ACFQ0M_48650 [Kitasatospora aburaviensis]
MGTAAASISAIYSLTRTLTTHAVGQPVEPDTLLAAERHWRELAACWRPVRTAPDSPTSMTPVSAESHALVDRVGRLLFADPGWRLADGGDGALRDTAELIDTLPTWSEALRHVNGQLQHLAQDHAALTQKLAETRRLLMRASGPVHNRSQVRPLIPERQAELRDGYLAAAQASGAAEDVLALLATSAGVDPAGRRLQHLAAAPPAEAADRALVRQSAARLTEQGHPAQPDQRWALSAKMRFHGRGSRF